MSIKFTTLKTHWNSQHRK